MRATLVSIGGMHRNERFASIAPQQSHALRSRTKLRLIRQRLNTRLFPIRSSDDGCRSQVIGRVERYGWLRIARDRSNLATLGGQRGPCSLTGPCVRYTVAHVTITRRSAANRMEVCVCRLSP